MIGKWNLVEIKGIVVDVESTPTAIRALHADNPVYGFCNALFVFNNIRNVFTQHFNLLIFKELEILALITFLGLYFFLTILLKTFSSTELEFLETFFGGNKKAFRFVRKFLMMFKKITYRNKDS